MWLASILKERMMINLKAAGVIRNTGDKCLCQMIIKMKSKIIHIAFLTKGLKWSFCSSHRNLGHVDERVFEESSIKISIFSPSSLVLGYI